VTVTVNNGVAPFTYLWARAAGGAGNWAGSTDSLGGADFNITSPTSPTPTFSRTTTNADGLVAQNWRVIVTGADGRSTQAILEIMLEDDGYIPGGTIDPIDRCVHADSWIKPLGPGMPYRRARDIRVGDAMRVVDPDTGVESIEIVSNAQLAVVPGVKVYTRAGAILACSATAPLASRAGQTLSTDMEGLETYVEIDGKKSWSLVEACYAEDNMEVMHITVGGKFFFAGLKQGWYIAHHNMKYTPDPFDYQNPYL
jgi:hypothetical protein